MNVKRLKTLSKHLRRLKSAKHRAFNMISWFSVRLGDQKTIVDPKTGTCEVETTCGTSACALGHACFIPEFQRAGLKLVVHKGDDEGRPVYKGRSGFGAGEKFFGISDEDSLYLFDPGHYDVSTAAITPKMVADRIDRLIEDNA